MMNCSKVQNLLSCYIDRELPGMEMLAIQKHLDVCSECAKEYQALLQVKRLLSNLVVVVPSPDMEGRLAKAVAEMAIPNRQWSLIWGWKRFRPLALAATVAALALTSWYFGTQTSLKTEQDNLPTVASSSVSEVDHATLDAYLSGKLRPERRLAIPTQLTPLHPYDNRVSLVSVQYYR